MSELLLAARVNDPVSHSYTKAATAVGVGVGLAVGIILAYVSKGKATQALTVIQKLKLVGGAGGFVGVGAWLAGVVADALPSAETGKIKEGASRTLVEDEKSARITDPVECEDPAGTLPILLVSFPIAAIETLVTGGVHSGAILKFGSSTVWIEDRNASRLSDKVDCESKVSGAAKKTLIGGETVVLSGSEIGYEEGVVLSWTVSIFGWISTAVGWVGLDPYQLSVKLTGVALSGIEYATGVKLGWARDVLAFAQKGDLESIGKTALKKAPRLFAEPPPVKPMESVTYPRR